MEQAKKPLKKGAGIHKTGLASFKEKNGYVPSQDNITMANNDKPMSFIEMPKGFKDAVKLPGFPQGYVNVIAGFQDTGKSLLVAHLMVAAQRQGLIPVIYDTENNMSWKLLQDLGFKCEPIYGDVEIEHIDTETGEVTTTVENQIIGYDGNFLYMNNRMLAEKYGSWDYSQSKEVKNKRKQAVLEDIARNIKELLAAQDEIGQGFLFIWDSIGSISSFKSYSSKSGNKMFDAAGISDAFTDIWNDLIPSSRKISSKYTNTFVGVNKVWLDSMSNPVGIPTQKLKGGNTLGYGAHGLLCRVGGALTSGTKKLTAVSKGATYRYGTLSKIAVTKNHLPNPWTITYEGEIVCTPHGLISKEDLSEYQKAHIPDILKQLNNNLTDGNFASEKDVTFIEEDVEES